MTRLEIASSSAPEAIGPYSQAIVSEGLVFCSGQIPLDPNNGQMIVGTIEEQTHQVMQNLAAVLEAAGSSLNCLLRTTIYLQNLENFAKVNEVYSSYLAKPYPARSTIEVSKLPRGADVEIDAIARLA